MLKLLGDTLRTYLQRFPIDKGKWAVWEFAGRHADEHSFERGLYSTVHGFKLHLDPADYIERFIYYWGQWEPNESRVILRYLKAGDRFVDVGANVGYFTVMASRKVGPTGRVDAFEPVPDTLPRLRRNLAANGCTNVHVHECALSNERKTLRMFSHGASAAVNSMRPSKGNGNHWDISSVRLDDVLTPEPDIRMIKIDVEGAELLALKGMRQILQAKAAPLVLCEITEHYLQQLGSSGRDVYALMSEYGYRFAYDCQSDQLTELQNHERENPVGCRNILFSSQAL